MKKFLTAALAVIMIFALSATYESISISASAKGDDSSVVIRNGNENFETLASAENSDNGESFTAENIVWIVVLLALIVLCVAFMVAKKRWERKNNPRQSNKSRKNNDAN